MWRPVRPGQKRCHRRHGQINVTGNQGAETDTGVAHEQLKHVIPALTVEAIPDTGQRPVGCLVLAERPQRHRHASQSGVQRTTLETVDANAST